MGSHPDIPFGAIVGKVDLVDCKPTGSFTQGDLDAVRTTPDGRHTWTERVLGNFALGRYGWVLENPVMFENSIPFRGRQGLFEVQICFFCGERLVNVQPYCMTCETSEARLSEHNQGEHAGFGCEDATCPGCMGVDCICGVKV